MSGHAEDPVLEESKRFFTFFNLSMILVAITGIEIVIIYVETFEGSAIISVLFATSILKFVGVVWWFMHLRWDKILNTMLFLLGLVIALGTFFCRHLHGRHSPCNRGRRLFRRIPFKTSGNQAKTTSKVIMSCKGNLTMKRISITRHLLLSPSKLTRKRFGKSLVRSGRRSSSVQVENFTR